MSKANVTGGHFHAVRFYEDDNSLCRIVSGFVAEGLALDQPALIIATQPHIDTILENLAAAAIDVGALQARGDLLLLDVRQTLATFMVDGQPDPDLFSVPDLPGCVAVAPTRDEVERLIQEAIGAHLAELRAEGIAVPEPLTQVTTVEV